MNCEWIPLIVAMVRNVASVHRSLQQENIANVEPGIDLGRGELRERRRDKNIVITV